jgi:hypothetical protein
MQVEKEEAGILGRIVDSGAIKETVKETVEKTGKIVGKC